MAKSSLSEKRTRSLKTARTFTIKDIPPDKRPLLPPSGPLWCLDGDTACVVLPPPHAGLHAHAKGHWSKKSALVRALRWMAKQTVSRHWNAKPWSAATIDYLFLFSDDIRRDAANAIQSMKPAIDGIVDAGLIAGDDWRCLQIGRVTCAVDSKNPRTILRFTRTESVTSRAACPMYDYLLTRKLLQ